MNELNYVMINGQIVLLGLGLVWRCRKILWRCRKKHYVSIWCIIFVVAHFVSTFWVIYLAQFAPSLVCLVWLTIGWNVTFVFSLDTTFILPFLSHVDSLHVCPYLSLPLSILSPLILVLGSLHNFPPFASSQLHLH